MADVGPNLPPVNTDKPSPAPYDGRNVILPRCIWKGRNSSVAVKIGNSRRMDRIHRWLLCSRCKYGLDEGQGFTYSRCSRHSTHSHHTGRHQWEKETSCSCRSTQVLGRRGSRTFHAPLVKAQKLTTYTLPACGIEENRAKGQTPQQR